MDIKQLVKDFNKEYMLTMEEMEDEIQDEGGSDIEDMSDEEYEETVGELALEIAGGNVAVAIEILEHPDAQGGWMMGDPVEYLKKRE